MKDDKYTQFQTEKNGFKIIFEFPVKPNDQALISNEIKPILVSILQEHLNSITA